MKVLAVGCHPDDLEIACFGTLARYVREGAQVTICHVANGNLGHAVIRPDELRRIRIGEAKEAAALIGVHDCTTLDVGDLEVRAKDAALLRLMVDVVRRVQPDVVITHDPADYMQDHREVSQLVFDASFSASVPFYETPTKGTAGIAPLFYMDTLAGVGFLPEQYVDVTSTVDLKITGLAAHHSQIDWMKEHDGIDFLEFVRTCTRFRGLQSGVAYAEGFRAAAAWPRLTTKRLLP
jgi:N-acetylglucosamine malate deacetylase 1